MRRSEIVRGVVVAALLAPAASAEEVVRQHALPDGATAPGVTVAGSAVHVVYGLGKDALHLSSSDGGRTFGAPVRVNDEAGDVFSAAERGPRVAVGGDGTVHVVWSPDRLLGVRYARRGPTDDAFSPAVDLRYEGATAAEGTTVAAHGDTVWVLWLDGRSGEPKNSPVGLSLFGRVSRDGGRTFGPAAPLAHDYGGGACACCHLAASVDHDGRFLVAFRGAKDGVRDVFLLRSDRAGRRFRVARLTDDRWEFRGCPMDGPRFGAGGDASIVAHTVDGRVDFSRLTDAGARPPERPDAPRGRFPLALQRLDGTVLLAWVDGDQLRWVVRDAKGRVLDEGTRPSRSGSRPTGFVDADGVFVLLD